MSLWFIFGLILLVSCGVLLFAFNRQNSKKQLIALFFSFSLLTIVTYVTIGEPFFTPPPPSPIDSILAKAEAHLKNNPDDLRGWKVLAPVYTRTEQFEKAVHARREILRLEGENQETILDLAENLILLAGGKITPESLLLLQKHQETTRAAYYLALNKEQSGDKTGAIAALTALLSKANEQEKLFLQQEIDRINAK